MNEILSKYPVSAKQDKFLHIRTFFYMQDFYKQHQAEIGKKSSK